MAKAKNKYKSLLENTAIFAIGTFSSKFLVYLLLPIYTIAMATGEFGTADILVQTTNLLVPLVTIGIINSIIRFGLDKSYKKSDVFTTGLICIGIGFAFILLFIPLVLSIDKVSDYTLILYLSVLMSSLRQLCNQFVRAKGYIKLYAFDGFFATVTTCLLTILFLLVFKLGITGYMLAIIVTDFLSALGLFIIASLYKHIKFKGLDLSVSKAMIKYALPLIPTTTMWWIINVSDRYLVTYFCGSDVNGLYALASKIPSIVVLISTVFIEAWQVSAVTESQKGKQDKFFSTVFNAYSSIVFLAASGITMFCKMLIYIMSSSSYHSAWEYIPFLVIATSFNCFVTFVGSIYIVEKKSVMSFLTTLFGAVTNIVLNLILIPIFGANGAAFATFVSYFAVYVARMIDTKKYMTLDINKPKFYFNLLILILQAVLMILNTKYWILFQIILFAVMVILNMKFIIMTVQKIMPKLKAIKNKITKKVKNEAQ